MVGPEKSLLWDWRMFHSLLKKECFLDDILKRFICGWFIWVFHDRRFCQIIWQIFTQGTAKKILSIPVGIETRTARSSGQCLTNWARQESVGQEISEVSFVCFMHHFTCWTLFISRINRAWLYKGYEDPGWQLNVDLAQLARHWPEDPEVLVSNPTGGNFWWIFFLLFPV